MIELIQRAQHFAQNTAVKDSTGVYTYNQLLRDSQAVARKLSETKGKPIAFLMAPGYSYVTAQWAVWRSGNIAVPLCPEHPLVSLQYILQDTGCTMLIVDDLYRQRIAPLAKRLKLKLLDPTPLQLAEEDFKDHCSAQALILYTSGTTSKPKGVVITHENLTAQIKSLSQAWHWTSDDSILNVLPLHHVHGIVNVLCCGLWNGATVQFISTFEADKVAEIFNSGTINLFMAVPTIYYKLIEYWESLDPRAQYQLTKNMSAFRLMVSGSAALPVEILNRWQEISGQRLLERYGMTEIGMALSNSYHGERFAGHVGLPLPGVQVKLMDHQTEVLPEAEGEIWVKGPGVFQEYLNLPKATRESFHEGWFKTGDIAKKTRNGYKILGRDSVDIIKSGGYKLSALEIEDILLKHPSVKECGVIGVPDLQWGEIVCAVLVVSKAITTTELDSFILDFLPSYKKPHYYHIVDQLPRNVLGKLVKPQLKSQLQRLLSGST